MDFSTKPRNVEAKPYRLLTYSNIGLFLECPMKYYFRNILKIVPMRRSSALTIGSIYHDAIERHYKGQEVDEFIVNECSKSSSYLETNDDVMIQGMVKGFVNRFKDSQFEIIDNEILFDIPYDDIFHRCGKVDAKMVSKNGEHYLGEWKTTGSIDTFVKKIQTDNQANNYLWALDDKPYHGAIFRIAKKSALRQKKNESIEEFRKRIFDDYLNRPEENFHEEIVYLDKVNLRRWQHEVGQISDQIKSFIDSDGWYRNTNACWNYGSLCGYNDICKLVNSKDIESVKCSHYQHCEPGEELFAIK